MAEPYEMEERLQEAWDQLCEKYPKCSCCLGSIYPGEIYLEYNEGKEPLILCEKCLDNHTFDISECEVD